LVLAGGTITNTALAPLALSGRLTLDAQGDPRAAFILQVPSTLVTAPGSSVGLVNGAQACNVFWQAGGAATLGASSVFRGNLLTSVYQTVTVAPTRAGEPPHPIVVGQPTREAPPGALLPPILPLGKSRGSRRIARRAAPCCACSTGHAAPTG
jgi:hypothetical protein